MIRAIFFDLDGTLLTGDKSVLPSTWEVLRQCRRKGIRLFVATGRSSRLDRMLGWTESQLSLFDGGIYCNGACVHMGGRVEYEFLPPDAAEDCLSVVGRYPDVHLSLHMPDNLHAFNYAFPSHALRDWGLTPTEITPIDDYCLSHTMKILLFCENLTDSGRSLPPPLFSQLQSVLADRVNLYLTDAAKTVQIAPREATKYSAAERIRQSLHLAKDEIAVFGDDHNDAEMLSHCQNSVAMGNAPEEIRRLAAFTTKSCEEDGIAFALRKLLCVID